MGHRAFVITSSLLLITAACGSGSEPATPPAESALATDDATVVPSEPAVTTTAAATPATDPTTTLAQPTTAAAPDTTTTSTTTTSTTTAPTPPLVIAPSTIQEAIDSGVAMNLAHAGGDQAAPHSTMFAFREAVAAGANALELDVLLTADGVLIVQHDDTVNKTTNETGPVADRTLSEMQALDNAYWFSPECWPCQARPIDEYIYRGVRTGETEPPDGYTADDFRILTFRELAEAFPDLILDVEIKGAFPDAVPVAEQLAAEIVELDRTDSVIVVSFDDQLVAAFQQLAPDVAVSPGLGTLTDWFLNGTPLDPSFQILQLPIAQADIEVITAETVQRIHDEGRIVWAWADDARSQENEATYRTLLDAGVDGIITGRPAAMTAVL